MLKVRNNYKTKLTKSITASTTELQIDRAPSPIMTLSNSDDHFLLMLTDEETGDYEVIKCVGIIGRIVTVGITLNTPNINGRGYDNTTALTIDKDEDHTLRMVVTSNALDEFLANLAAIDASFLIASTAEAEAGVNDEHVLSSLKGVEMFEAYAPLASQIQAETGTDNVSRMSPLREKQGLYSYLGENLPVDTAMFFKQNTVPTNWVFDSSCNDMVILNTSTQSEGGSTGGSWTLSGISVNGHAVTLPEFPSHKHGIDVRWHVASTGGTVRNADWGGTHMDTETKAAGGGLAHTHSMTLGNTWRPAYSKLISCRYRNLINAFIFTVQTTSTNETFSLPLEASGTYDFTIRWGDETDDSITIYNQAEVTHTYTNAGTYEISINGTINGWQVNYYSDKDKIYEIKNWGCLQIGNNGFYFSGCSNLTITATDILCLEGTTTLLGLFTNCSVLTICPSMNDWDVGNVTTIESMVMYAPMFNQFIGNWDTSSIVDARSAFRGATAFNQNISNWVLGNNVYFTSMFRDASAFNQNLSGWDTVSGTYAARMFSGATAFNQNIGSWDISSMTDMSSMFLTVTLSTANYDALLIGWEAQAVHDNISFDGGNSKYTGGGAAASARLALETDHNWTIIDGGIA